MLGFTELRQSVEHHIERARSLAGAHHIDIDFGEEPRVIRQGRGQRITLIDRIFDLGKNSFERAILGLFDQPVEGWHQWNAGTEQCRQLPGDNMDFLWFHALAKPHREQRRSGGDNSGGGFVNLHRIIALASDLLPGGRQRVCIDDTLQFFARTGQGCEFIDRHGS